MSTEKQHNAKKPFKETGLGKILLGILPGVVKGASKFLPDSGITGVIKNLIDNDPDMSDEEKAAAHDQLVQLYKLEVEDRDSARKREAAIINSGGKVDKTNTKQGFAERRSK